MRGRVASESVSCFYLQPHYFMSEGCNTLSCCAVIFQLYDTDGDSFVTSNDVLALLRKTAGKALSENQLQQVSLHDTSWWQPLLMAAASIYAQHAFMPRALCFARALCTFHRQVLMVSSLRG